MIFKFVVMIVFLAYTPSEACAELEAEHTGCNEVGTLTTTETIRRVHTLALGCGEEVVDRDTEVDVLKLESVDPLEGEIVRHIQVLEHKIRA